MSANLEAKKAVVAEIEEKIEKAQSITIVEYKALTVEAITALRAKCRAAGVDYCVLKNTMVRRAMANKGIEMDQKILEGPNAYIFSNNDPISGPKLVKEFIAAAEKDKKVSALGRHPAPRAAHRQDHGRTQFPGDRAGLHHQGDCRQEGRSRRTVIRNYPNHYRRKESWKSMRSYPRLRTLP